MSSINSQNNYSTLYDDTNDIGDRMEKAKKIITILQESLGDLKSLTLLEIGSSHGHGSHFFAKYFSHVSGIEVDQAAVDHARKQYSCSKIDFRALDATNSGLPSESFDAIICSHIYEHVTDVKGLFSEIRRLLKAKGVCYFAGGNRLLLREPHHHLLLLSVLPKWLAHLYLRFMGRGDHYFETHRFVWELRNLVKDFEVTDFTLKIIENPEKYHAADMVSPGSKKQALALLVARKAYWLFPTFIWVLKKKK